MYIFITFNLYIIVQDAYIVVMALYINIVRLVEVLIRESLDTTLLLSI